MTAPATEPSWPGDVYGALREWDVTQFAYVPDSGHKHLINAAHADPEVIAIPCTTEEEGVGIVAGAHLGGRTGVLLMQSSGVGNTINFLSLIQHCRFPFLTLVTMRGDYGEQNPWQFAMGRAVESTLGAMGLITLRAETPEEAVAAVQAGLGMSEVGGQSVAVLFGQKLIGAKKF